MSYPVFLNAASQPRMPDGSKNEWKAFWADGGAELEGAGWPPLLWLALFKPADILWARRVDDEDLDSEGREDLEEFGEATYPYMVASRESALATLADRRKAILEGVGQGFESVLNEFEATIQAKYPRYVLCRTSGIIDAMDAGPKLEKNLVDFDRLAAGDRHDNSIVSAMADLLKQSAGIRRFLLVGTEYAPVPDAAPAPEPPALSTHAATKSPKSSGLLDWISALIVGLPTAFVYARLGSAMLAVLAFCVLTAIVVLVRVKVLR